MLNYSELTNKDVFKLIADKDQPVVEYIYDKYAPSIYAIILEKTKKDADEILTNTFIALFKEKSHKRCLQHTVFIKLHNIAVELIEKGAMFYIGHSSAEIPYRKNIFSKIIHTISVLFYYSTL